MFPLDGVQTNSMTCVEWGLICRTRVDILARKLRYYCRRVGGYIRVSCPTAVRTGVLMRAAGVCAVWGGAGKVQVDGRPNGIDVSCAKFGFVGGELLETLVAKSYRRETAKRPAWR